MKKFVAGVDGSEGSRKALEWAVKQAALEGAKLTVVHVWHVPYAASGMGGIPFDIQMLADGARETLDAMLSEVDTSELVEPVEGLLMEGAAAPAILAAAEDADMVIVGSRGRGGFMGLLLGSVSQQVASHSTCPVVIIPTDAP